MRNPLRVLQLIAIFALSQSFLWAEETLTWKDCVLEARKNHPDLLSAKEKIGQSIGSQMTSVSGLMPQVTANAGARAQYTQPSSTSSDPTNASSGKTTNYTYSLNGQQLVFDWFKTAMDVEQASKNVDSAKYNYLVTSSNIRLRLVRAFAALLKTQELLSLTEKIALRRAQNKDMIELRYKAGREHKGSLLTAEADLAQALFEVQQAMRSRDLAMRLLAREIGRTHLKPIIAKGELVTGDRDRIKPDFESMADSVPLLRQLVVLKEAARMGFRSAQASFFPQVYATGSVGKTDADFLPRKDQWSAGAAVSMPLFDGGNLAGNLKKNQAAFNQAQADEKSGRDGVIVTLEQTWVAFQDAREQVLVQRKYLEAYTERAKIAEAQYSTGLVSFNDWIIIENNLVSAEKSYLNAQADARVAEAGWEQAKGETLDDE